MDTEKNNVETMLSIIENVFPDSAEKISTVAFVNWHNILNHCALETMDEKQTLFCCNLILSLASAHYSDKSQDLLNISKKMQEVSFEDTISFLQGDDGEMELDEEDDDDDEGFAGLES